MEDSNYTSAAWITRVLNTQDTPLRTHLITLSYSKLATSVDQTIFGASSGATDFTSNANWFNFATWGTYSLGPNIRNDAAPQRLDSLTEGLRRRIAPAIVHGRSADGDLVGRALAWGQYLIFASVASAAIKFVQTPIGEPWSPPPTFKVALPDLTTGPASGKSNGNGGLTLSPDGAWFDDSHGDLVNEAFNYYWLARQYVRYLQTTSCSDPGAESIVGRLLLVGTVLLTAVEQDIVDRAIRTVIDAVPVRWLRYVDDRLARAVAARRGVPRQVVALNLLDQIARMGPQLTDTFARLMTDQMLVLCLPRETLRVGRDIPPLDSLAPMFPLSLADLAELPAQELGDLTASVVASDPGVQPADSIVGALHRLNQVVESLDRTGADGAGSGARDWRRFDDRLNWAICLFRSRQQDPTLFWPAYSQEDESRLQQGQLPRGRSIGPTSPPLGPQTERSITEFLGADRVVTKDPNS